MKNEAQKQVAESAAFIIKESLSPNVRLLLELVVLNKQQLEAALVRWDQIENEAVRDLAEWGRE